MESTRIVITGGPGAGKTALLEVVRRSFAANVTVLPEAASILFTGGFPRHPTFEGRRAAQRAIFHVQRQLEALAAAESPESIALCDRGTIDGLAYWPGDPRDFWSELGASRGSELARYAAVVHLRSPGSNNGYHKDAVRIETVREAREIDERILEAWSAHPRRHVIESTPNFVEKVQSALAVLRDEVAACDARRARAQRVTQAE